MENHYKQLTLPERYQIQSLCELLFSARKIGDYLHRSISDLLGTEALPPGAYGAEVAYLNNLQRRKTATKFYKITDFVIRQVKSQLSLGFTPEQIAGWMMLESFSGMIICQTIYRLIKQNQCRHLLPRKGKRYRQRKGVEAGVVSLVPNRVDIDKRSNCVDLKEEVGHWEGDTVYGQDRYLVTLAERVSNFFNIHGF